MLSNILSFSKFYNLFKKAIGTNTTDFFFEHKPGIRVLDVGCGPGSNAHFFFDTDYTGVDFNPDYIENANKKYHQYDNIKFYCSDLNMFLDGENGQIEKFDLIFMCGVLHHLNNNEVDNALSSISQLVKSGEGEFRSLDNVYLDNQSMFVKWLLRNDRGKYVRTIKEYEDLIIKHFPNASYTVHDDLLRIPYNHIIFSSIEKSGVPAESS
jgi:SAM-dependent methyltransferase